VKVTGETLDLRKGEGGISRENALRQLGIGRGDREKKKGKQWARHLGGDFLIREDKINTTKF